MRRTCLLVATLLLGGQAQAAGLDVSLSDESANFEFLFDSSSLGYGGADLGVGLFFNEDDDQLLHGNVLITSNPGSNNPWQFGVGGKAYYADLDGGDSGAAIGIGGLVRYVIPAELPMGVVVEGYHSPKITSFDDLDRFNEASARFEVEIMPSTRGYVGFRFLDAELDNGGDTTLDEEFHLGIRVFF